MTKLVDMDEYLLEVKNRSLLPSLKEAVSCYHASSYRACIILSFNSLVDDLILKLKNIKDVNNDAKCIYNMISELMDKQTSFENVLIEQLVKTKIFTELDNELYSIFQKLRHKSAHPSGFNPSPECARFVFTEIINRFLSKDSLQTTNRIDSLISDISEGNFFVDKSIKELVKVTKIEISNIHPDAMPQLINRVYKKYLDGDLKNNPYLTFLCSLSAINDSRINHLITRYIIKEHNAKLNHEHLFVSLISSNPAILNELDQVYVDRVIVNLKKSIQSCPKNFSNNALRNPFHAMLKICNAEGDGLIKKSVINLMPFFIKNKDRICYFMNGLDKGNDQKGRGAYIKLLNLIIKEIDSGVASDVDEIVKMFVNDDMESFSGIAPFRALDLIISLTFNNSGSVEANRLVSDKYEQILYLKNRARGYFLRDEFKSSASAKKLSDEKYETLKELFQND